MADWSRQRKESANLKVDPLNLSSSRSTKAKENLTGTKGPIKHHRVCPHTRSMGIPERKERNKGKQKILEKSGQKTSQI